MKRVPLKTLKSTIDVSPLAARKKEVLLNPRVELGISRLLSERLNHLANSASWRVKRGAVPWNTPKRAQF